MMRTRLFFIFTLSIIITSVLLSQIPVPTPEQRAQIIKNLDDPDPFVQTEAIDNAIKYNMTEILPLVEYRLWREDRFYKLLDLLDALHSPHLCSTAHMLADSAQSIAKRRVGYSYLQLRVLATEYLFRCGDYSTVSDVFDGIRDTESVMSKNHRLLVEVIKHVPAYADSAKLELRRLVKEGPMAIDRLNAVDDLKELYGQETFPEIIYMYTKDPDPDGSNRLIAFHYLFELGYPDLNALIRQQIYKEVAWIYRAYYADSLLSHFGSPSDYQFVQNYYATVTEPKEIRYISRCLQSFTPPIPPSSISIPTMIDTLFSYIQQCVSLDWLGDANFVKELDNHLTNAKKHLARQDSLKCAREVEMFQAKINKEYKEAGNKDNRFVTIEGWKFLYYNAQYIIERLITLPPKPTETVLKQIDNLKTELQNQSEKKNIGGALFVKGLTLLIDKAKKELQKVDSSETALYIALFQLVVDETWELTEKLEGKAKKSPAIYVYDEAYIALHYRAEYILEALPKPKKNIHEQRQQMIKEEPSFREFEQELDKMKKE